VSLTHGNHDSEYIYIIIVYYARRQQNHTDKTLKTQNYTTVYK